MSEHELAGLLPPEPEALVLYLGDDPNKSFALKGPPWDGGINARHTHYDFSTGAIRVIERPAARCRSRRHLEEHFLTARFPAPPGELGAREYSVWVRCDTVTVPRTLQLLWYAVRRVGRRAWGCCGGAEAHGVGDGVGGGVLTGRGGVGARASRDSR